MLLNLLIFSYFHFNKSIANLISSFRLSNSVWKHLDCVLILYGGFGEEKGSQQTNIFEYGEKYFLMVENSF